MRPFLPPLLAGALARANVGLDFDRSPFAFLEQGPFLLVVFALAVAAYAVDRRRAHRRPGQQARDPLVAVLGAVAVTIGALLFAGSLAAGGYEPWPGLVAGALCAGLGYAAAASLFGRVRRRLDPGAAAFLPAYADAAALAIAAVAVFVPPLSLVALVAFGVLLVRGRRRGQGKYQGLRILR